MPGMEEALYVTSPKEIKGAAGRCSRVYFGAEFCQWRMPGAAGALSAFRQARDLGLRFTLMTPWVTDQGVGRLKRVLASLARESADDIEVVVNDLGVLMLLNESFSSLTPVLGRLLSKQKRCPRIPGMLDGLPGPGREVYLHAGFEDPVSAKLWRGFGVGRVELDSPLQGVDVDLKRARLKGSLYTPFAYVTTTRYCPASFDGERWQAFTGCRLKGCLKNVLVLKSAAHAGKVLMRGNTQFVENALTPPGLLGMGIDRVVRMEDVP